MSTFTKLRIIHFNPWADRLEDAATYCAKQPQRNVENRISKPGDQELLRMAKLDCDWHGECTACFASLQHSSFSFLPAFVAGPAGVSELLTLPCPGDESWVFVIQGHHPQKLGAFAGKVFAAFKKRGIRIVYYAFDEASCSMPCFGAIAPFLDAYIHDENPIDQKGIGLLPSSCLCQHRSWVANIVPYSSPFVENPEKKIVYLGSGMGFTPHRQRQVNHLKECFKDRFVAIHDHSLSVGDRFSLNRYHASLCPEGRKFTTPAMAETHTDRPFWSGCLGLVPISEDSAQGGRLEELHQQSLILRYPRGDLKALVQRCEQALDTGADERRRIYDFYNQNETVGRVIAKVLAQLFPC